MDGRQCFGGTKPFREVGVGAIKERQALSTFPIPKLSACDLIITDLKHLVKKLLISLFIFSNRTVLIRKKNVFQSESHEMKRHQLECKEFYPQ